MKKATRNALSVVLITGIAVAVFFAMSSGLLRFGGPEMQTRQADQDTVGTGAASKETGVRRGNAQDTGKDSVQQAVREMHELTREEFQRLTIDQQAAFWMNIDIQGHSSVLDYFLAKEAEFRSGEYRSAPAIADLYERCLQMASIALEGDHSEAILVQRKACSALPSRGPDYAAELVGAAAASGNVVATLRELGHPPERVRTFPRSAESELWARGAISRLEALASAGNLDATNQLAYAFSSDLYGLRDISRSRRYAAQFLSRIAVDDPRRRAAAIFIDQLCRIENPNVGESGNCK